VRHLRMVGVCLIAVFAIAAVAATSASALPEWGKCVAKAGGKYTNSNCTTKGKGGTFEYLKASQVSAKRVAEGKSANIPFSGKNVGSGGVLRTGGLICETETQVFYEQQTRQHCIEQGGKPTYSGEEGISVECEAENNTGEAEGKNKVANIHVTFTGCTVFGSAPCSSAGAAEGEIKVNPLKGALGYLNKSTKEVGVMLEPAVKKAHFADFNCGGLVYTSVGVGNSKEGAFYLTSGCIGSCETATPKEEAHGGYDQIISPITPVNTSTTEFTQVYKVSAGGENIPSKFEGKHISLLEDTVAVNGEAKPKPHEGIMWSPAGEEITNVNTPEEEGMIKA
jgi:hypothetical protein